MKYISTRGQVEPIPFQRAVLMGLADDGGLLIPGSVPDVSDRLGDWRKLEYPELAFQVIRLFATDIPEAHLRGLLKRTYGESYGGPVAPVVAVGPAHILELFHGPTLSFKDVALQLLGNLFEYILEKSGGRLNILGATSGDTGSAAIHGCRGRKGIHIFILHPAGRVSRIQQRQMTTVLDENVHNIAVQGSFDDCQRIMKTLASDLEFKRAHSLGAVNSVNWARVLAQIVYYFHGAFRMSEATGASSLRVCVPTGNFGNILAAWYALQMGAPISRLILATNENDILARFFGSGVYRRGEVHQTLAPAMDIQVASNFERYLFYRVGSDSGRLRGLMESFSRTGSLELEPEERGVIDERISSAPAERGDVLAAIRSLWEQYNYLIDPHTACGWSVAERAAPAPGETTLCIATAHPAKFPAAIEEATGRSDLARHPRIDEILNLPERFETVPNDVEAVRGQMIREMKG